MTDDEQTEPEVDEGEEAADAPSDSGAADAARAAAEEASGQQIEDVKAGEDPSMAIATPHGLEGDYDPVAQAEDLPDAPEPEAAADGDGDDADAGGDEIAAEPPDAEAQPPDADAESPDADAEPPDSA